MIPENRLHVKIQDQDDVVYQVPESVFPRPQGHGVHPKQSALSFKYTTNPFSFSVSRTKTGEVLFDTSAAQLVFQSQYVRLRTKLPVNPNLYGLGEHSDPFRLNTTDYVRTMWSQDAFGTPDGSNLYGNHPVYFEHRTTAGGGTHGVFLLNSNGMDINIDRAGKGKKKQQYLEYNTLGGVLDLYFVAGPGPVDVARQYAEIVGTPAMVPYWSFGLHNCRYGYRDVFEVAEVVANYSAAKIPLETMWTDIDYMDRRRVSSLFAFLYLPPLSSFCSIFLLSFVSSSLTHALPTVNLPPFPFPCSFSSPRCITRTLGWRKHHLPTSRLGIAGHDTTTSHRPQFLPVPLLSV